MSVCPSICMSSLSICLNICLSLDRSISQFSSGPPVCDSPSLFAIVVSLLHHQLLNSSASSHFPRPFPTLLCIVLFFLVTMSLFAEAICCPPCLLVHTTSAYCFPFFAKLFVLLPFCRLWPLWMYIVFMYLINSRLCGWKKVSANCSVR